MDRIGITILTLLHVSVYAFGIYAWLYVPPQATNRPQVDVTAELQRMLIDDKTNPVCEYYVDTEGYEHGCMTDVQLDAIDNITKSL